MSDHHELTAIAAAATVVAALAVACAIWPAVDQVVTAAIGYICAAGALALLAVAARTVWEEIQIHRDATRPLDRLDDAADPEELPR